MTNSMCINVQLIVLRVEILTTSPLVTWNAVSDYVTFPTVANIIAHVGLTDGIGRIPREFMDKLSVRVMPILSNPAEEDSDGDGIWDDFDPQPLIYNKPGTIYNRQKAVEYALFWGQACDGINGCDCGIYNCPQGKFNPNFHKSEANCTNFVSQVLHAGGFEMDDNWFNAKSDSNWFQQMLFKVPNWLKGIHMDNEFAWTKSWVWINDLYSRKTKAPFSKETVTIMDINFNDKEYVMGKIQEKNIREGDIIFFYKGGGFTTPFRLEHAMVITQITQDEIYLAGNTRWRTKLALSKASEYSRYDFVKMDDFSSFKGGA